MPKKTSSVPAVPQTSPTAAETPPPWLTAMRSITGLTETPGSADNPKIMAMSAAIAEAYPDMKWYCDLYTHDETAWCGLAVAYAMTKGGIRPVFQPKPAPDTDRYLWAEAWASDPEWGTRLDAPRLGCVVVKERSGGAHVTLYESTSGSNYNCRGGNQSDMVNVSPYPISEVIALVWPKAGGPIPPAPRTPVALGDSGPAVAEVQRILALPIDSEFGPQTEAGVKGFQGVCGIAKDGEVGPTTWAALDTLDASCQAGNDGISNDLASKIDALVDNFGLDIDWPDRGTPPPGYYAGMAKTFALAVSRYNDGDAAAAIMAQAKDDPDEDALAYYAAEFAAQGMDNNVAGLDTLRHLFVMAVGLGMRESSGDCWCGRDMSASNTSSTTAESGLFQTSWNISSCSGEIGELLDEYRQDPNGFQSTFGAGLSPSTSDLDIYGSGDGATYQWLSKFAPAFHVLVTAIGMRRLRAHWGPIGRREVDIMPEVDDLLLEVQQLVSGELPGPVPPDDVMAVVNVNIRATGEVKVIVNGEDFEPVRGD